ncbi:MAG: hypothetical protein U9Q33_05105 [Campylobacterota bacterium]|nr:hypothetical protein [Campylobacterota bacterium]
MIYTTYDKPYQTPSDLTEPNKIYLFFVILETMQQNNIIDVSIKEELKKQTHKYKTINSYLHSMGIPQGWLS